MKFKLLLFLSLLTATALAQLPPPQTQQAGSFSAATAGNPVTLINSGFQANRAIDSHKLNYVVALNGGTMTSLSIQLEGDNGSGSFTLCGQASTAVAAGTVICNGPFARIRVNLTSYVVASGAPVLNYVYQGSTSPAVNLPGSYVSFNPSELGANALAYTSSGTTALTNIIDMRGAKSYSLTMNGGLGITTINVQLYMEDGVTTSVSGALATACAASTVAQINQPDGGGAPNVIGTCTLGALVFKQPMRAMAFSWTNTNATAGSVTARLVVSY